MTGSSIRSIVAVALGVALVSMPSSLEAQAEFAGSWILSVTTDNGVTNFLALSVNIVLICAPLFFKDLINSKLLYAEIPPHIIKSIFLFKKLFIDQIKILIGL